MTDVDVLVVEDATPNRLPPNGYTVVTKAGVVRAFRCAECVVNNDPRCECVMNATAHVRRCGVDARVMRGTTCIAFTSQRTYAEALAGAEAANRRAKVST